MALRKITDVEALCSNCGWKGTVGDCEPDDDGSLICPNCGGEIITMDTEEEKR